MATVFKLALDKNGNAGLLSIVGEIRRNSHLKQAAEKESANGYIMSNSAPCGGHLRFDITTIIGDIENDSNALFDFVKATVDKPERYAYTQGQLKDYFADADFSVQRIEQLMGKFNASFGETGAKGFTVYTCANIQQVVFSILHFLILNGYKFANCRHCGRLYATKTLKKEYCNRKSTFKGYEEYSCGEARKQIVDTLKARRIALRTSIKRRWGIYDCPVDDVTKREAGRGVWNKWESVYWDLETESERLLAKIKEQASVENLKELQDFLYSEKFPKPYEREVSLKR